MFDHKRLFGFAAILFGIGFILQSIMPARAISMGPSVSMGSNPVFAVHASGQSGTIFTNNTSSSAIITDLAIVFDYYCTMTFSGSNSGDSFRFKTAQNGPLTVVSLNSGLKVPAGESLSFSGDSSYCLGVSVSGYYAH